MTASSPLPPIGDVFACVPDAARVDKVELERIRYEAGQAGLAGDLDALSAMRERVRVIVYRHPGDLSLSEAARMARHTIDFQFRKVKRCWREGGY